MKAYSSPFNFWGWDEYAILGPTLEVPDTINRAIILTVRIIKLHSQPEAVREEKKAKVQAIIQLNTQIETYPGANLTVPVNFSTPVLLPPTTTLSPTWWWKKKKHSQNVVR